MEEQANRQLSEPVLAKEVAMQADEASNPYNKRQVIASCHRTLARIKAMRAQEHEKQIARTMTQRRFWWGLCYTRAEAVKQLRRSAATVYVSPWVMVEAKYSSLELHAESILHAASYSVGDTFNLTPNVASRLHWG